MYQVNPRVFAPEKSLLAVADRIDSIKALGVNVMWVMPIYPIGIEKGKNSPYCIRDYKAIAPEFGTIDDFKHLARVCHEHGMGIILDWVANHTAWDHPWVKEHPDWYTHDENADTIIHPRPWDWYDVADLNYDNKEMRKAMIDAMKYWIADVGIDGFRCDVADGVPADFWKEAIDTLRQAAGKRQILMLAEGKRPDNFTAGFDMNYGWDFKDQLMKVFRENAPVSSLFDADKAEYDSLPEGKVKLRFTTNHDHSTEQTPPVEFNTLRGSMAAYVASVFLHGGALIYGSQEVAYPEPINFFKYVPVDWTAHPEIYKEYKDLISIYNETPVIRYGDIKPYPDNNILAFERSNDSERVLVMVNLRDSTITVPTPQPWLNKEAIELRTKFAAGLRDSVELAPYAYFIFQ
ncbi:MAG: alpha-glucosidase C-terminal domain-containing protein [Prevotella sp.]|nr:alpha-glucosidase C-terminal domain-containing protein [Prevotella sp.]